VYAAAIVRRPRIVINALSLTPGGGGHSYLANVLRELSRDARGYEFSVVAGADLAGADAPGIVWTRVPLPRFGHAARVPMRVAYEQTVLPAHARAFDLLYCPADLVPALIRTPTVVQLQNLHIYDKRFYGTLRLHALERLVRAGLRRARRIVFSTRAAAESIAERIAIPDQRIAVVPHGVSYDSFDAGRSNGAPTPPYLFLPASLERHKRVEVLIRSLQHVENPELEAWIAGTDTFDTGYAAELRRLAQRLGLASRVRFIGQVPYREILNYYRGSVALAFTSDLETFGQPMLEAMLAETPILAADIPAFREIAGDIAVYFAPDDAVGLARAADRVRRERDAAKGRIARGRARASEFSWKRSMDQLCQVFEEVFYEARADDAR
jgi:glycosyltransferase involved in cell wall biosynthesis